MSNPFDPTGQQPPGQYQPQYSPGYGPMGWQPPSGAGSFGNLGYNQGPQQASGDPNNPFSFGNNGGWTRGTPYAPAQSAPWDLYGGYQGGYRDMRDMLAGRASGAMPIDYSQANADRAALGQTQSDYESLMSGVRGNESALASQLQDTAMGKGPSAAAAQMQQGTDAAIQAQQAAAASARGGEGAALAQRQAGILGANLQQQNVQATGIERGREAAQAQALLGNVYGTMGGQIGQEYGTFGQQDIASRGMSAQEAQAQAEQQYGYTGMLLGATNSYDAMNQAARARDLGVSLANRGMDQAASQQLMQVIGAGTGAVGEAFGAIGSDIAAKTDVNNISGYGSPYSPAPPYGSGISPMGSLGAYGGDMAGGYGWGGGQGGYGPAPFAPPQPQAQAPQQQGAGQPTPNPATPMMSTGMPMQRPGMGQIPNLIRPGVGPAQPGVGVRPQFGAIGAPQQPATAFRPSAAAAPAQPAQAMAPRPVVPMAAPMTPRPAGVMPGVMSDSRVKLEDAKAAGAKEALQYAAKHPELNPFATPPPRMPPGLVPSPTVALPPGSQIRGGLPVAGPGYTGPPPPVPWQRPGPALFQPSAAPPAPPATPPPGAIPSDERGKDAVDHFLDATTRSASTYRYKHPSLEPTDRPTGGTYAGVMAQDMEMVPALGPQLVKDGPRGKYLEGGATMSALLAASGKLNARDQELERRLRSLEMKVA
jgi:hypothetical protein